MNQSSWLSMKPVTAKSNSRASPNRVRYRWIVRDHLMVQRNSGDILLLLHHVLDQGRLDLVVLLQGRLGVLAVAVDLAGLHRVLAVLPVRLDLDRVGPL